MNEKYLNKLNQDMERKNLIASAMKGYPLYVRRFFDFTGGDAMSITYTDIRKFIFHL